MGCTQSAAKAGADERLDGLQTIGPDPDLGWRVMPASIAATVDPKQFVSFVCPETGRSMASEVLSAFPLYPQGPRLCFFNDRSGQFFAVDIATLALNMSVRAVRLAQKFGVAPAELGAEEHPEERNINNPGPADTAAPLATEQAPAAAAAVAATPGQAAVPAGAAAGPAVSETQRQQSLKSRDNDDHQSAQENADPNRSSLRIYELLGVPDCGWTLKNREPPPRAPRPRGKRLSATDGCPSSAPERGGLSLEQHLQRVGGLKAAVDVPSVGMNIAEQLFRLERKTDDSCPLPFNAFGWKVNLSPKLTQRLQVTSPSGELLYLVPEELIMNVTQWVQQTYFTSTAF